MATKTVPMILELDAELLAAVTRAIDDEMQRQCASGEDLELDFIATAAIMAMLKHQRRQ